ncbi:hypothetical protein L1987_28803 [Smallanthus sonchifolius]|uniref:Uncharacterized protein n=1 Tax=Smallanthus sonchifolius TaxID=185202 RepID=A0ACB9HXQ1_9ASTR|nr:hypothetical protein L1987_28803 [Smallanthus sonchifolius]
MEGNFQGDLADIFRPGSVGSGDPSVSVSDWQYFDQSDDQETQMIQKSTRIHDQGFGQPFTSLLADPFIDHEGTPSPCFFGTTSLNENLEQQQSTRIQLGFDDHNNNNQSHNIFSKMLQISSSKASSNNEIITSSSSSSKRSLMEASTTSLQISSPRNPAIKRSKPNHGYMSRKSQAKKVVCIPAPTPINSRPTGYRPELPDHGSSGGQTDDFFSGLGEIEGDPISMLLNHGFLGGGGDEDEAENYNKDLDPFG